MVISADTSFLFSLYAKDIHTNKAIAWLTSHPVPLTLSVLCEYELGNALRFAEYRKAIGKGEAERIWGEFETDKSSGRIIVAVCNLSDLVNEAKRISSIYTLKVGHRAFDILHVAAASKLKASHFLTFDANQKRLARAEGFSVPF